MESHESSPLAKAFDTTSLSIQSRLSDKEQSPVVAGGSVSLWMLVRIFRQIIREGSLTILAPDGAQHRLGQGTPTVTIRLTTWSVVRRLLHDPDLAVGEAYMDGTLVVEEGGIYDFLKLCMANTGWGHGHWLRHLRAQLRRKVRLLKQYNPVGRAQANVAHHYDLSVELYQLFLDADRQYSCAYYLSDEDTLEQAQQQKKHHLAAKLLLEPGQRVLDIGSGWGGLALYLGATTGVSVTGVTLSGEQHIYAQRRAEEAGLSGSVQFRLKDYRHEVEKYDRIVSVGMFEHVGVGHYREYFEKVRDLLTDDGVALIHTIGCCDGPSASHPWLHKYIFPGGYTPALSEILPVIERAGLFITDIEILRLHYAETLRAWRQRFLANRDRVSKLYDERFCRMWEFYLAGCEAAFRHAGLTVFQIQLSKRIDAVPLTRDYIPVWERKQEQAAT